MSATFCGPTSAVSCEKTELSETAIALVEVDRPERLALEVVDLQSRPPALIVTGFDDVRVLDGEMSSRSAAASTNGLNAEPGWRSPCVARLNWLLW